MKRENLKREGRLRRFAFHRSRFVVLAAAVFTAAGCAIPQVPSRTVYEDPVNFVRLELDANVLPEWPPGHFTHPARFSHEQVRRVLMGLTVQEHRTMVQRWIGGDSRRLPMFRDAEIVILVPQLVEALRLARENERVTYYLSQPQTSVKRTITSGGLYIRGTELHFILGNWQTLYGIPAYGMIYDRRYPMNPIISKGFDLFFDLDQALVHQTTSIWDGLLANTKDELVIDLAIVFPGQSI
ncbi:MAG TPA: hypothetical protein PKW52_10980 [Nitrospira sp.]|nr:hypothetical protein [Nitrospiraceae bacterium]HQR15651.1 hypothetical protein [Nitrospira sp.]HQV11858.1 hypothetical protein [Nitrospira sp.]